MSLAQRWRSARPPVAGLHLDTAACSRQSYAAIAAAADHARHEAELGGYVAAEAARPVLDAGRDAVATLTGVTGADVNFTTGATHALNLLLGAWPAQPRMVATLPGEYGPNLAVLAAHGFDRRVLPVDGAGRVDVAAAEAMLAADPPAMVHLTAIGSHRGLRQPAADLAASCRRLGVPLVVDAAQALGHVDCAVGADAVYATSRKWLAGPRGVGVLAIRSTLAQRLRPQVAPAPPNADASVAQRLEWGEANVAARVGFAVAVGEYLAAGPAEVRRRLAEVGALTRTGLADVEGWRVVEPTDEPTAITTLEPTGATDVAAVRARLLAEHRIVTTLIGVERAPDEVRAPALRFSPHVELTDADIEAVAAALRAVSR